MLDMVFSQHDLAWLDDILPEKEKKKKEDEKKTTKDKKKSRVDDSEDEVKVLLARACQGLCYHSSLKLQLHPKAQPQ